MITFKKSKNKQDAREIDSLGRTETFILAVLADGRELYGVEMQREIKVHIGRDLSLGSIYGALTRLEKRRYIEIASIGEATKKRGGRKKIYFKATEKGVGILRDTILEYDRVREILNPGTAERMLAE